MPRSTLVWPASAKENDGRRHRQRWVLRLVVGIALVAVSYHLLWTYWLAGVLVSDTVYDQETGRTKYRRHKDQLTKYDPVSQQHVPTNPFDGIMEGYLTLISVTLPQAGGLIQADDTSVIQRDDEDYVASYQGVKGTFCHIAWNLQQRDPSNVPMFRDLQQQSPLCRGTLVSDLDLYELAQQARQYDAHTHNFTTTKAQPGHQAVPPTAVVFHETRCGSTLVSNMLASSQPEHVRSYSEAPPPLTALMACDVLEEQGLYCDEEAQLQLVRDVFYLMGRVTRPETPQYVFYKIQSVGVRYLNLFTKALPQVPWAFVYRDSVEIIMSHFKQYQNPKNVGKANVPLGTPVCLRSYGSETQNPILLRVVQERGRNVTTLTKEEYCAAHLASLAQAAVDEFQQNPPKSNYQRQSWFFNYQELPHAIWESWLPRLHMGYIDTDMKDRMQQTANMYSKKGRGNNKQDPNKAALWKEDSTMKQARAPASVKQAARLFLDPLYERMESIQKGQK